MIFGEDENAMSPNPGQGRQQPQPIRLETSQMETVYANFFAIAGSPDEIVLYVGANSPLPGVKDPMIKISHRVMLLPQNAKRLLMALTETVKQHEDRFGPIEIAPQRKPDSK